MKDLEIVNFRIVTHKDHLPMAYFQLQNGLKFRYLFDESFCGNDLYVCQAKLHNAIIKNLPNHNINPRLDEFCPIQKVNKDIYKKILFGTTEIL